MSNTQDANDDVERLYNALKENKMNTARLIHTHLRKIHKLDAKTIRESVRTMGLRKTVEVAQQNTDQK